MHSLDCVAARAKEVAASNSCLNCPAPARSWGAALIKFLEWLEPLAALVLVLGVKWAVIPKVTRLDLMSRFQYSARSRIKLYQLKSLKFSSFKPKMSQTHLATQIAHWRPVTLMHVTTPRAIHSGCCASQSDIGTTICFTKVHIPQKKHSVRE